MLETKYRDGNRRDEKNSRIREKRKETLLRRKTQEAKTFELKLDRSKISRERLSLLKRLFLEAKWFTNYVIANGVTNFKPHKDYKIDKVYIKVNNTFEEREIRVLSSQMRQGIIKRLQDNIRGLAELKKKGVKVGRIRFRKVVHSIPSMQYGITYTINREKKMMHIQCLRGFKVLGLEQIPDDAELTTANLVERNGDYYVYVTCYIPKQNNDDEITTNNKNNNNSKKNKNDSKNKKAIGIDLGIRDQITFSNGVKIAYSIPVSKRLRRLYHWFSRSKFNSRNREKLLLKIKREFYKQSNMKRDVINKVTHYIINNYDYIVFQKDDIHSWQKLFGQRIYETSIGELRNALKKRRKASTPIEVDRFIKTTGVCPICKTTVELKLSCREFICPSCNSLHDRDVASAIVIKNEGLSLWNVGETPEDEHTSASSMLEYFSCIPHVKVSVSMNREAPSFRKG